MTESEKQNKEEVREEKLWTCFEQVVQRRIQHYYISRPVEEPTKYAEMIHNIQTASPDTIIYIHLNTPGGNLNTGIQLINAMKVSEAHIVASLEGEVASLGTMIFLAADEFVVHDNSIMMFHNYSGGVIGKGHEQRAALEATSEFTEKVMKTLYVPFMSEDEFESIRKGADIYFQAEEVRRRLIKMVKVLEREQKEKNNPKKKTKKRVAKKQPATPKPKPA